MYVKLVSSGAINAMGAIRDVGRLITSSSPNVASLGFFSSSSSIVIDATPAGWTYVGSNNANDQPYIGSTSTSVVLPTTSTGTNLCFSSPTLANNTILKYACLTTTATSNANNNSTYAGFCLSGAVSASSTGVVTSEGFRNYIASTLGPQITNRSFYTSTALTIHLIANPQHITMIWENTGMTAVWESSQTDAHTFYGAAPFIQYTHLVSGNNYFQNTTGPVAAPATNNPYAAAQIFNLTDCNTGTNYGAYDVTDNAKINLTNFFQNYTPIRTNSITASGLPSYQISPVFYSASARGYPTQFVTGIVPVYWCSPNLGNSGDTVAIGSDTYYFFNAGSGFGMLMKTS